MISFFVPGNPKGQMRHRSTKSGHHYDPSASDKKDFLAKAMQCRPDEPFSGPVCLRLICVFPRPKSHYRTGRHADTLKESAPIWHSSTPDWDNVGKFVGDALNSIFWKDDRLIVRGIVDCIYGDTPGIHVQIREPAPEDIEEVLALQAH